MTARQFRNTAAVILGLAFLAWIALSIANSRLALPVYCGAVGVPLALMGWVMLWRKKR